MGRIVIAVFRPKPGKENELLHVIANRLPLLRRLGLATDRTNITMRAADGTILDVSEWADDAAIERAHHTPEVLKLWQRFDTCCAYVKLDQLAECHLDFATFDAVAL
jgi:quinol monooxygenase YgiN